MNTSNRKSPNSAELHANHSIAAYFLIYVALVILTLLTCGLSFVSHFPFHTSVGLAIASTKVVLILLFFMHLLHSGRLTWLALIAGLLWFALLIGLTMADYLTRAVLSF
jgi:cytochrome c oxidase subunit IV